MRDYFRNRQVLGSIRQLDVVPSFFPRDGLVAYYKLDGNGNDIVSSYNGTSGYSTASSGKINQGLACGGSNYMALPDIPFSSNMSICGWGYANSWDTYSGLINIDYGDATKKSIRIVKEGENIIAMASESGGAARKASYSSIPSTGAWHFYAAVANGSTLKFYIDNVEVASVACGNLNTTYSGTNWSGLGWGKVWSGASNIYFNGTIDEVSIWNRALTSDEITQLYNNGNGLTY